MGTPTKPSIEPENGPLKKEHPFLDGGFNQVENYKSNWIISPGKGEHNKKKWNHQIAWKPSFSDIFRFQPFVFWGVSSCKNARTASCLETFCSPRNLIPLVWYFHDLLNYSPGIHRLSMDFPKIISTWHMYTHVIFCSFCISSDLIFGVMWLSRVVSRWTR